MISEHTKAAIIALINIDADATDAERERVRISLTGVRPHGRTIRIAEAARILGVHRNTISNWISSGRLTGVRGGGRQYIGVTEESLATA